MTVSEEKNKIQYSSSEKSFFTILPNIILNLGLSGNEVVLYLVLRKIAGEGGKIWMFNKNLATQANISVRALIECKKSLAQPRKELNGKALISMEKRKKPGTNENLSTIITLTDIWPENMKLFVRDSEGEKGVVQNLHEGHANTDKGGSAETDMRSCKICTEEEEPILRRTKEEEEPPPKKLFESQKKELSSSETSTPDESECELLKPCGEYGRIKLTDTQLTNLQEKFSPDLVEKAIDKADKHLKAYDKTVYDCYAYMQIWIGRDKERDDKRVTPVDFKEQREKENKAIAQQILKKNFSDIKEFGIQYFIGNSYVEVGYKKYHQKDSISYREPSFKQQLQHVVTKTIHHGMCERKQLAF